VSAIDYPDIDHRAIEVAAPRKLHLLLALLKHKGWPPSPPEAVGAVQETFAEEKEEAAEKEEEEEEKEGKGLKLRGDEVTDATTALEKGSYAAATPLSLEQHSALFGEAVAPESLPSSDLKERLRARGLQTSGSRSKLLKRLAEAAGGAGAARASSASVASPTAAASLAVGAFGDAPENPRPVRHAPTRWARGPLAAAVQFSAGQRGEDWSRVLVFVASQKEAERVAAALGKVKHAVATPQPR
jgi:hypothetical protein